AASGLVPVLPWGSDAERLAARRLAEGNPAAVVAPRMSLAQCAALLGAARCVVGVDTGLTHLACALDVPTVALFAATPAWRAGAMTRVVETLPQRAARGFYSLAWYAGAPLAAAYLLWRSIRQPAYRRGWASRFGLAWPPASRPGRPVWIHAVSVGETMAARPL